MCSLGMGCSYFAQESGVIVEAMSVGARRVRSKGSIQVRSPGSVQVRSPGVFEARNVGSV